MSRSVRGLRALALQVYALMATVAFGWAALRGLLPAWWRIDSWLDFADALGWGLGLGLFAIVVSAVLERTVEGVRKLGERFATILAGARIRDALLLAALSSVGEELLFRGCLQQELGLWPATILFALVHSGPERVYLWWTGSALFFGLLLGLLYDLQGGLLAPIVMHFTINAVNIRLLGLKGDELVRRSPEALEFADPLPR